MRRERACKGCDGSGWSGVVMFPGVALDCLACRGTGRVVDLIPAADAVADAETLWRIALVTDTGYAQRLVSAVGGSFKDAPTDIRVRLDTLAARAAFRAVPGLRG